MPQYILVLEAVLVPGLDGALVIGRVKGDVYEYNPSINIHAFALNHVEAGLRVALLNKCREVNAAILKAISDNYVIVACGGNAEVELGHTLKLLSGDARRRLVANYSVAHPSVLTYCKPKQVEFVAWAEIKISRRLRAESSRRPPRHRRDACSMAWRCRFLTARRSQHGHVISAPGTLVDFHTGS